MNLILACILFPIGLVLLLKSADLLVDGAVGLARRFGISPLIIGLTVVAMGTSAPEVAASVTAALTGTGQIALGNVYGSNVANLALVGGLCALVWPLTVSRGVLRRELPVMLLVTALLWPVLRDGRLSRLESLQLLVVFFGLLVLTIWVALRERREGAEATAEPGGPVHAGLVELTPAVPQAVPTSLPKAILLVVLGLIGLPLGAYLVVESAKAFGRAVGISDAVLGITVVAIGTSLPELLTSLVAVFKRQDDISVGNLVGSNIFNTLLVVGAAGTSRPLDVGHRFIAVDYAIMLGTGVVFWVLAWPKRRLGRVSGAMLLVGYVAYMVYLFVYTRTV